MKKYVLNKYNLILVRQQNTEGKELWYEDFGSEKNDGDLIIVNVNKNDYYYNFYANVKCDFHQANVWGTDEKNWLKGVIKKTN